MKAIDKQKSCFVISPIDKEGTDVRIRSDKVLKYIIKEALDPLGYTVVRADEIGEPGLISGQVISRIIDDNIVVADLTGRNPNVFYELALRHAVRKPFIQIMDFSETLPFDVADSRTIFFDIRDLESVANAKTKIIEQVNFIENNGGEISNPISNTIRIELLRTSTKESDVSYGEILSILSNIQSNIEEIRRKENLEFSKYQNSLLHNRIEYIERPELHVQIVQTFERLLSQLRAIRVDISNREDVLDIDIRRINVLTIIVRKLGGHISDLTGADFEQMKISVQDANDDLDKL